MEVIEEHWEKSIDTTRLWIFVKIFDDLVCFKHIAVDDGVAKFETIEFLAHANLVFNHLWRHSPILLWQRQDDLVELTCQTTQISTDGIRDNLRGFGVDTDVARLEIALDEHGQVAIAQFFALKEHASRLDGLHIFALAPVDSTVFMAHHEDGRRQGLLEIPLQRLCLLDILRFLDDDHLIFGHHGITTGIIGHLRGRHIRAEQHGLIEVALLGLQHMFCNIVADLVDIIRLLAHQIIDGCKTARLQIGHDTVETCIFCLCHSLFSIIICTFALAKLQKCFD